MKRSLDSKAYNALLTLLDGPKRQKQHQNEPEIKAHEGDIDEFIVEDEQADAHEDQEEQQQAEIEGFDDDNNEGDCKDPFETHFVDPPVSLNAESWKTLKTPLEFAARSVTQVPDPSVFDLPSTKRLAFNSLKLKYRLESPWKQYNGELTNTQKDLLGPVFNYEDILMPQRTWQNYQEVRNLSILHLVNHIYKTRDRVLAHNYKLGTDPDLEYKDQGFTRPKVLVVLPMRNSAVDFVEALLKVSGLNQCENRKRFMDSFHIKSEMLANKPKDFQKLFAGNTNDLFCLGVKFTRQALKLYSSFYSSDLIIASPLGLRLIVAGDRKKADYDFLSSIEIMYMDQVEAMQMQSWENVSIIAKHLNLMPKQSHDCDFSRIRSWSLEDKSKFLRQTIMLSSYLTPEMQGLYSKYCLNLQGKLKCRRNYEGIMSQIGARIRQVCTRIDSLQFSKDPDARFNHFTTVTLPSIMRGAQYEGTFIYVPSYVDFVRLRNYMDKKNMSFATLSEYTSTSQLSRGRTYFADGRCKMMLYTQRLHYFRRYSIKGCHQVVFYGLPDDPIFYQEIVRFLARTAVEQQIDPDMLKVQMLFSKWDSLKLERIVGSNRVGKMVEGASDSYEFY